MVPRIAQETNQKMSSLIFPAFSAGIIQTVYTEVPPELPTEIHPGIALEIFSRCLDGFL